jgi:hypothetical protein
MAPTMTVQWVVVGMVFWRHGRVRSGLDGHGLVAQLLLQPTRPSWQHAAAILDRWLVPRHKDIEAASQTWRWWFPGWRRSASWQLAVADLGIPNLVQEPSWEA